VVVRALGELGWRGGKELDWGLGMMRLKRGGKGGGVLGLFGEGWVLMEERGCGYV